VNIRERCRRPAGLDGPPGGHLSRGHPQWNDTRIREVNPKLAAPRHHDRPGVLCTAPRAPVPTPVLRLPVEVEHEVQQDRGWPKSVQGRGDRGQGYNAGVANMTHQTDGRIGMSSMPTPSRTTWPTAPSSTRRARQSAPSANHARGGRERPTGPSQGYHRSSPISGREEMADSRAGELSLVVRRCRRIRPQPVRRSRFRMGPITRCKMSAELDYVPLAGEPDQAVSTTWQTQIKGCAGLARRAADAKRIVRYVADTPPAPRQRKARTRRVELERRRTDERGGRGLDYGEHGVRRLPVRQ